MHIYNYKEKYVQNHTLCDFLSLSHLSLLCLIIGFIFCEFSLLRLSPQLFFY